MTKQNQGGQMLTLENVGKKDVYALCTIFVNFL